MLLITTSESKEINLLGDLNVNYHKKCDHKEIKEIFKLYGLRQIVTKATQITETTRTLIDCILTSRNDCTYESDVFPTSISDHDMVGFIRKVKKDKLPPRTVKSRNYAKYNHQTMKKDLHVHDWELLYRMSNANSAWLYLKDVLLCLFNKHAPIVEKRVKGNFCPWLNTEINQLMNERDKALKKVRKQILQWTGKLTGNIEIYAPQLSELLNQSTVKIF